MTAQDKIIRVIDWFIPNSARIDRAERSMARNFVFTHLCGPAMSQSISIFLFRTDPAPGLACWTIIVSTWLFWLLPFVYRKTANLQLSAFLSVALLAFTSLFGAYFYGGVSSPFLPWMLVSMLIGFFYLSDRPLLVVSLFAVDIAIFCTAYLSFGFPQLVSQSQLVGLGWMSILSATVYMSWMAIYYASILAMRSELERETERHRETGARLRKAKDMAETANHAKSIFLAKMSHELRTPLNAVIGYSQILIEDAEDEGDTSNVGDLKKIHEAGEHLLELINRILDLSKIEAGKMELNLGEVHVARAMRELIHEHRAVARANNNQVSLQVADDIESVIWDAARVGDIFGQVYDNAHKFTKDGEVSVTVRRDRGACDRIAIDIRDTGIGIAPEHLNQLFETFSVVDDSSSSKYGGTGLGLALALRMTELMGGTISVESELGSGTCFSIVLPVTVVASIDRADGDAATTLAPALPEGAGHRGEAEPVLI